MCQPQDRDRRAPGLRVPARRVTTTGEEDGELALPLEEPLAIEINGRTVAVLMRTPGDDKALALGYCLSEGLVRSLGEVLVLHHCGSGAEDALALAPGEADGPFGTGNRVRLLVTPEAQERLAESRPARWVFSACGGVDVGALGARLEVGQPELQVAPEVLYGLVPGIARAQEVYRATGGIHAAALADRAGTPLALGEDVGRHNAVDKVIGAAALHSRLPAAVVAATGRASSDIVAKAARVGIPIVASFSSVTSLAVRLAEAAGVTLIGYLRRNRFTVYTHPQRIAWASGQCLSDRQGPHRPTGSDPP
jgi:FdhD protein